MPPTDAGHEKHVVAPTSEKPLTEQVAEHFRSDLLHLTHGRQAPTPAQLEQENQKLHQLGFGSLDIVGLTPQGQMVTAAHADHTKQVHAWGRPAAEAPGAQQPGKEEHQLYNQDHRTINRDSSGHVTSVVDKDKAGHTVSSIERNEDGTFTRFDANHKPIEKIHDLHVTKGAALDYKQENGNHVYQHVTADGKTFRETTPGGGGAARHEQIDPHKETARASDQPQPVPARAADNPAAISPEAINSLDPAQKAALKEWVTKFLKQNEGENYDPVTPPQVSADPRVKAIEDRIVKAYSNTLSTTGENDNGPGTHWAGAGGAVALAEQVQRQLKQQPGPT